MTKKRNFPKKNQKLLNKIFEIEKIEKNRPKILKFSKKKGQKLKKL